MTLKKTRDAVAAGRAIHLALLTGRSWSGLVQVVRYGGTATLLTAFVWFVAISWRWPVVNDAALMHYCVLLQQHGWAPYRMIHDINLPGAYVPDWLAMKISGRTGGDLVWRLYDYALLGAAAAAMVFIAYPQDWFAGVFAGGVFALFHGRDGIGQAGQRDLAMAVLFLLSGAAVCGALRSQRMIARGNLLLFGTAGFALGVATTIKPFGFPGFLLLMICALRMLRKDRHTAFAILAAGLAGFVIPLMAMVAFLLRQHAWGSFFSMCRVSLPYHAQAARPSFTDILAAAMPASLLELSAVALVILLLRGSWRMRQTQMLLAATVFGLFCFFVQHKGYGYQRYPYLGFLLLWVGLECTSALRERSRVLRGLGAAGLLFGVCVCAPSYLGAAAGASWPEPYLHAIEGDLRSAGGPALNRRVQCIDSISGCTSVLYRMRLEQATGTLYDELLFPPAGARLPLAVDQGQQAFLRELAANPPQVFIVASWLFPEGPGDYGKLALWPAFRDYLDAGYRVADQQSFPRSENGPLGFRMYVRR